MHSSSQPRYTILRTNPLDPLLQLLHITPDNSVLQSLPILEQHKSRHSAHLQLRRNRLQLIHVNLDEAHIGVSFAELADNGSNGLAGPAPGGEEVDDDWAGGCQGFEDDGAVQCIALAVGFLSLLVEFPPGLSEGAKESAYLSTSMTLPWAMVAPELLFLRL